MNTYPHAKKRVSYNHIVWAYEGHLRDWAQEGASVALMQVRLRKQNLRVGREAILSVVGGLPVGGAVSNQESRPE